MLLHLLVCLLLTYFFLRNTEFFECIGICKPTLPSSQIDSIKKLLESISLGHFIKIRFDGGGFLVIHLFSLRKKLLKGLLNKLTTETFMILGGQAYTSHCPDIGQ